MFGLVLNDIQQLLSSSCRPVTAAKLLNFFKIFCVQCTVLVQMICRFPRIQFLRQRLIKLPNTH